MINLNDFAKEVHSNSVAHGWWDEPRSFGEIIALCHSELSEALEEYRDGRPMVWFACKDDGLPCEEGNCVEFRRDATCEGERLSGKPEGIAVELADCVIRILDWCGKVGAPVDEIMEQCRSEIYPIGVREKFGDVIAELHGVLSVAYHSNALHMVHCILQIFEWAAKEGVDMEAILRLKHEYNKTRPYKHNGKVI